MPPAKLRLLMIAENAGGRIATASEFISSIGRKELASHTGCAICESLVLRQPMPSKAARREHGVNRSGLRNKTVISVCPPALHEQGPSPRRVP